MKRIFGILISILFIATAAKAQYTPYLMYTLVGGIPTLAPVGTGAPLPGGVPPSILCYTLNASNQSVPCSFGSTLALTTTGSTGAATLSGGTLNIPIYSNSGFTQVLPQQVLGTVTKTITFSPIPQTFTNLRLVINGQSNAATLDGLFCTVNGDAGANYDEGLVSSVGNAQTNGMNNFYLGHLTPSPSGSPTSRSSIAIIDFPSYSGTTFYKDAVSSNNSYFSSTPGLIAALYTGEWHSTAAITSIACFPNSGSWTVASTFTLYGY